MKPGGLVPKDKKDTAALAISLLWPMKFSEVQCLPCTLHCSGQSWSQGIGRDIKAGQPSSSSSGIVYLYSFIVSSRIETKSGKVCFLISVVFHKLFFPCIATMLLNTLALRVNIYYTL